MVRGFVLVPGEGKFGYVDVESVTETDRVESLMDKAMEGLMQWMDRYSELSERLPGLFRTLNEVVKVFKAERRKKTG